MESAELRSEILSSGSKYYVQTHAVPAQNSVVTSLFHEGRLLSTSTERYDASSGSDQVRALARRLHEERKLRITSLLEIREQLKNDVDPRAHLKLGEALHLQRLFKEAMAEVIRAVKLGLEDARSYSILGNCLHALEDYDKALKSFKKGIELSPDYPDLYNDLGTTYLALKRCREAADAFEKALQLNRYYQAACLNLALALALNVVLKQDYELSRDLKARMKRILELNIQLKPSLDTEDFRAALQALDLERYDAVHQRLLAVKEMQERTTQPDLSLELYLILKFRGNELDEGDLDAYIARVRSALDANPGYADLHNDLGILYAAKCKRFIDRAGDAFAEALRLNRDFAKAEKNLKLTSNDRQGIHFLLRALLD